MIASHLSADTIRRRLAKVGWEGYRKVLEKHKIPYDPALCVSSPVSRRGGYDAIQRILDAPKPPTAAYCYGDVIAFGVILGLRATGIEAGKAFAVIGFDNVAEASLWQPSLTTVSTNPRGMGRTSGAANAPTHRGARHARSACNHAISADQTRFDRVTGQLKT